MKQLIQKCKQLERKAQREMVDQLSPFLFPICRRYASSFEDAKDLLQETLILIFNNIEECAATEAPAFKAWCRRIAINNALSKKRKHQVTTRSIDISTSQQSITPSVYSRLNVEEIMKLLKHLPEQHAHVFNLSVIDGYAHREIAELLGIKESSSRTFLVRARQVLQELILNQETKRNAG